MDRQPQEYREETAEQSEPVAGIDVQWARVRARLRREVGEAAFRSWLMPLQLTAFDDGVVEISVATRFIRDWIHTHYAGRIRALFCAENTAVREVRFEIDRRRALSEAEPAMSAEAAETPAGSGKARGGQSTADAGAMADTAAKMATAGARQLGAVVAARPATSGATVFGGGATLDARFTFESFVVAKPNELAHAAAQRVAGSLDVAFNPLFLYGGAGLGKTHLMHAIAWASAAAFPQRSVVYMSAETFMNKFIRALRQKDTVAFKEQFRSVDLLMIDDVQFIIGKDSTQEEFFHTFNALVDQNKQIVLSADKSPADLEGLEERLRSRLGWGLVADIHPTTYELRVGILESKAERQGLKIPHRVVEFLAHRITSNVRELEGALNRIVAHATLVGRPITMDTTQEVLQDLLRAYDRRITIADIQRKVAEHFNVKVGEMTSNRRARAVARPRQVAMYLAKQLTSRSLPDIGKQFGGRDHTTVMYAVRKVEELQAEDPAFAEDVELLRRLLKN